jgi:hypothetical protein
MKPFDYLYLSNVSILGRFFTEKSSSINNLWLVINNRMWEERLPIKPAQKATPCLSSFSEPFILLTIGRWISPKLI